MSLRPSVGALSLCALASGALASQAFAADGKESLSTRMVRVARALAPGMRPISEASASRLVPIHVEAGHCYALLAVAEAGVTDLDVLVFDTRNHRVAGDIAANATPMVHLCARQSATWIGELRVRTGEGAALAQWFAPTPEFDKLLDEDLGVRVAELSPGVALVGAIKSVELHKIATLELPIHMGECYVIAAAAGHGVRQLWMLLLDPLDRVARAMRSDRPTAEVEYCPEKKGAHRLTLRAFSGEGDARVGVYRRRID